MSRKLIGFTTLAAFALALMMILAVLMGEFESQYRAEQAVGEFAAQLAFLDEDAVRNQRNLARWYNFCISAKEPQLGFQEAYGRILDISDGMMGYLSFSDRRLRIPVNHNALQPEESVAAGHVPGSALPLGGRGNHTVLTAPAEISDLEAGDIFCIHIPGDVLYYSVREVRTVSPGQTGGLLPVAGEDLCTLAVQVTKGAAVKKVLIHGVRTDTQLPIQVLEIDKRVLTRVLWAVLAVLALPGITGAIGLTARWTVRKWNCGRLTKNKG